MSSCVTKNEWEYHISNENCFEKIKKTEKGQCITLVTVSLLTIKTIENIM